MNYEQRAKKILIDIYDTPEDRRVSYIAEELLKAFKEGHSTGWAYEQDKELLRGRSHLNMGHRCEHSPEEDRKLKYLQVKQCSKCGDLYHT